MKKCNILTDSWVFLLLTTQSEEGTFEIEDLKATNEDHVQALRKWWKELTNPQTTHRLTPSAFKRR